jgi:predicted regulator of Ras-like GTPase activity (Roadblock/LC7/MglB family)
VRTLLRDLGTVSGVQCACIVRKGEVLATTFPDNDKVAQAASLGFVRGISDGLELVDRGFEEMLIDFSGRSLMVTPVAKDFVLAMLAAPDANKQLLRVVMGSSARQLRRMHDIPEKAEAAQPKPAAAQPAAQQPAAAAPGAAPRPGAPGTPPPPPRPQPAAPPPPPQTQAAGAKPAPTGRPQPPQPAGRPAPPPPPQAQAAKAAPPPPPRPGQAPPAQPQAAAKPGPGTPPPSAAKPEPAPAAAASKVADKDAEPVLPQVLALLTEYIGPVARVSFKRGVTRWRETSTPTVGTLGELAKILAADLSSDSEKKAFLDAVERLRGS